MRKIAFIAGLGLAAGLICGCGQRRVSVTMAGSTAFQPFAEKLADEYMATHPDVNVTVQGGGSAVGIKSALDGVAEIGMADLAKLPPEAEALSTVVAARDGIALVVHKDNAVDDLTTEQIRGVFNGQIRNWSELGGDDHAVRRR